MRKKIDETIELGLGDGVIKGIPNFLKFIAWLVVNLYLGFKSCLLGLKQIYSLARYSNNLAKFAKTSKKQFIILLAKDIFCIAICSITGLAILKFLSNQEFNNLLGLKILAIIYFIGLLARFYNFLLGKISLLIRKKWFAKFDKISFKDSNGKYPDYLATIKKDNQHMIIFDSYIPLETWENSLKYLNQIFNCEVDVKLYDNNFTQKVIVKPLNPLPEIIHFDENKHLSYKDKKIMIGLDKFSNKTYIDFGKFPHWSIAGDTGSGKSTLLKLIYTGLKKQNKKMVLIDLKGLTLKHFLKYEKIKKVYSDIDSVEKVLKEIEKEHDRRLDLFKKLEGVEDLKTYNQTQNKKIPEIFLLIDEIARITVDQKKDKKTKIIVDILKKLAQLGRSQGFHLIFISQRPDADTIDPKIRACLGGKISGPFKDPNTAEIAINDRKAFLHFPEIKGRMLIMQEKTKQFQSIFIKNENLDDVLLPKPKKIEKNNNILRNKSIIKKMKNKINHIIIKIKNKKKIVFKKDK